MGISLNQDITGTEESVLNSEVSSFQRLFKYANGVFGTGGTVLFMEVSSIQRRPY